MFIITHLESFAWYRLYPPFRSMRQRAIDVHKSKFQADRPYAAPPATAPWLSCLCRSPRSTDVMSNFRLTEHSDCSSPQTKRRGKRDITSSWAVAEGVGSRRGQSNLACIYNPWFMNHTGYLIKRAIALFGFK